MVYCKLQRNFSSFNGEGIPLPTFLSRAAIILLIPFFSKIIHQPWDLEACTFFLKACENEEDAKTSISSFTKVKYKERN